MPHNTHSPARRLAVLGVLAALTVALSYLEGLLPALPIPGAKLGLSHLVLLLAMMQYGLPSALALWAVKAGFALLRGVTACLMSAVGGLFSLLIMYALYRLCSRHVSCLGLGLAGAAAHNMGQLLISVWLTDGAMLYYAPPLLWISLVTGTLTGLTAQVLRSPLQHLTGGYGTWT